MIQVHPRMMEADLTYFDWRHVSTPDAGGDSAARVSILGERGTLASRPSGCSTLYEMFMHGMKVGDAVIVAENIAIFATV